MYLPPLHRPPTSTLPPVAMPSQATTPHVSPQPRPRLRAHPPVFQPSSCTQSLPPTSQPRQVRLATPPLTPRHPAVPNPGTGLAGPPPRNDPAIGRPQVPNDRQPRIRFTTPVYPHLVTTNMVRYFKIDDGVSYLPVEGTCDVSLPFFHH